jgi:hypothetical protein
VLISCWRIRPEDYEILVRQKEELLRKREEKERQLSELIPDDVDILRHQKEELLAQRAEKERQLVELLGKQQDLVAHSKPRDNALTQRYVLLHWILSFILFHYVFIFYCIVQGFTLSGKKRGRGKRGEEDEPKLVYY